MYKLLVFLLYGHNRRQDLRTAAAERYHACFKTINKQLALVNDLYDSRTKKQVSVFSFYSAVFSFYSSSLCQNYRHTLALKCCRGLVLQVYINPFGLV